MNVKHPSKRAHGQQSVTGRALLLAFLLIPFNVVWVVHSEGVWGITYLTIVALFFNVVTTLFFVVVLNWAAHRAGLRAFSQGELLTVFSVLSVGCSVAGNNFTENLVLHLGFPTWYATPENEWRELFFPFLPSWLIVPNREIVQGFYRGDSSIWQQPQFGAWAKPLGWWFCFILVFLFVILCLNVLMRRQWTEIEKLSYPVIQVPFEMTRTDSTEHLFRKPAFQIGFFIAAGAQIINGLHYYYPVIPAFEIRYDDISGAVFKDKPWDAVGWTPFSLYFWTVGMIYFIPLELSFSCWAFYFLSKFLRVLGSAAGLYRIPGFPYAYQQTTGAWLGLLFSALWFARGHLQAVLCEVLDPPKQERDSPISYRTALFGFVAGIAGLTVFLQAAGFSVWVAVLFLLIALATNLTITKVRAELGPPQHEFYAVSSDPILATTFGTAFLGRRNVALFPLLFWMNRTLGSHPSPHMLEAFKLAQMSQTPLHRQRRLAWAMLAAAMFGYVVASWSFVDAGYRWGVESRFLAYVGLPWESFGWAAGRMQSPQGPEWANLAAIAVSTLFSMGMMVMRARFLSWPLHPVGYVLSSSGWIINYLWLSFFVTWFLKVCILRWGGFRLYRRLTPLFVGFVVGEVVVGSLWSLLGVVLGRESYGFYED